MIFEFFFSKFKHGALLFYIIIKSSYQLTYKPKMPLTLYISFLNFDVFNDLYKFEKEFKKKLR